MKKFLFVMLILCSCAFINAQDIIYFQNGTELKAKILEIKTEVVSYKKYNNLNGATYESLKKEIHKIKHQNGEIEIISPEDNDGKTGIGFQFLTGDTLLITAIDKNSSAAEMGILVGDKIIKIDSYTKDKFLNQNNVQNMLDGPVGTNVDITIIRGAQKSSFLFTLGRRLPVIIKEEPVLIEVKKDSITDSINTAQDENIKNSNKGKPDTEIDRIITSSKHMVGFQTGFLINIASYYAPPPTINATYSPRVGYYVGFYYQHNFIPSISLKTGISFSGLGASQNGGAPGDGVNFNYMDINLAFQYNIAKPWLFQPYFFVGPVFSMLLSGTETYSGISYPFTTDPLPVKFIGIGATLGGGVKVPVWKKLYVSGEFQSYIGILNIEGDDAPVGQESRLFTIGSVLVGAGWRF